MGAAVPAADARDVAAFSPPLIELRGVRKLFREGDRRHLVLDGVDAEIHQGEITVLLGKSGSGKSTLLNLVSGIDVADAGAIVVDGARPQPSAASASARSSAGVTSASSSSSSTCCRRLRCGRTCCCRSSSDGRERPGDRERARELLDEVDLDGRGATRFPTGSPAASSSGSRSRAR